MEDRRVIKTKKNLKATLIEMMGEISFEQISITELCKRAETAELLFTHTTVINTHWQMIFSVICFRSERISIVQNRKKKIREMIL